MTDTPIPTIPEIHLKIDDLSIMSFYTGVTFQFEKNGVLKITIDTYNIKGVYYTSSYKITDLKEKGFMLECKNLTKDAKLTTK
jgi:hypothetical protein